eukprot:SAG11_NODE_1134_length_5734_cov_4.917480_2_plen_75_part_00
MLNTGASGTRTHFGGIGGWAFGLRGGGLMDGGGLHFGCEFGGGALRSLGEGGGGADSACFADLSVLRVLRRLSA